jgi:hypothetical protein
LQKGSFKGGEKGDRLRMGKRGRVKDEEKGRVKDEEKGMGNWGGLRWEKGGVKGQGWGKGDWLMVGKRGMEVGKKGMGLRVGN